MVAVAVAIALALAVAVAIAIAGVGVGAGAVAVVVVAVVVAAAAPAAAVEVPSIFLQSSFNLPPCLHTAATATDVLLLVLLFPSAATGAPSPDPFSPTPKQPVL